MPTDLSVLDAVIKDVYEGSLREQLDQEVKTLRRIVKTSEGTTNEVGGRYVTFPVHVRRNQGIGARSENTPLPASGSQKTAGVRIPLKYLYGSMGLTGQAISLVKTNYQAFISAVELETKGLKEDLAYDTNRQVYGNGVGTIGTITGIVTDTELPVDRTDLFQLDMIVDICTLPSTVDVSGRVITAIDHDASTVTISGAAITTAANDVIVRTGNLNLEWTGFESIIQPTGELYNLDPATEPVWAAYENENGGTPRAVSESLFTTATDEIRRRGGKNPSVIFYTLGIRRAYAALLQADRQYVNTQKFTGGFEGLAFATDDGEIPMVTDVMCTPNTAYFVNEDRIKMYRESDWRFMDYDGSKFQRKITSSGTYDAYEATMLQYSELGTDRRNAHGVVRDLTEA